MSSSGGLSLTHKHTRKHVHVQALNQVHQTLKKHHKVLQSVFRRYAIICEAADGVACVCMLPAAAWAALLDDCG